MADPGCSRVLVTGGAGFIGRRVVSTLLECGADVTVADKQPFPDGVVRGDIRMVLGDLRDPDVAARALDAGTDVVIHLAALTSVLRSVADPAATYEVNVAVTANLLELSRAHEVGTFMFASTNAVAGDVGRDVITERTPLRPLTPYGATKAAAEMLLSAYTAAYGINGCSLRFSNVYGPGMAAKDSFVPRLMRAARSGTGVDIYGDGCQLRDLVHVDDIVQGLRTAWRAGYAGPLILASGKSDSVNEILAVARRVTGAPIPARHVPPKPGEMPAVLVDIAVAGAIGYEPAYDLESGLATVWPEFAADRAVLSRNGHGPPIAAGAAK
ncbi:MAG TPA: NAD-dependent epimerase/dehydratase family protein [Streptosporangiaceae bacterium]|nr:NAD-dependent epimerase/dehydratase family protein [Streptosporangiaceae bacterium]